MPMTVDMALAVRAVWLWWKGPRRGGHCPRTPSRAGAVGSVLYLGSLGSSQVASTGPYSDKLLICIKVIITAIITTSTDFSATQPLTGRR